MKLRSDQTRQLRPARVGRLATLGAIAVLLLAACGETTVEPLPTEVPRAASAVAAPEPASYVVERSDTLARIADKTGVSVSELVALNTISDPNVIEVGDVLLLEAAPVPVPDPERSIVSREPVDRSLGTQLSEWWSGLYRPDLNLSDRSLSQGAVAGLMLPAAVLAFVALWLGWQGVRRLGVTLSAVGGRAFAGAGPRFAIGGSSGSVGAAEVPVDAPAGSKPSLWSRATSRLALGRPSLARLSLPRPQLARPQLARPRLADRGTPRADVSVRRPSVDTSGLRRLLSRCAAMTAAGARRLVRTPAIVTRGLEARRERDRERAARREAEAQWLTGAERLRIGLLDDAYASFNSALQIAREHDWQEEVDRNLAALDDIAARRQAMNGGPSVGPDQ